METHLRKHFCNSTKTCISIFELIHLCISLDQGNIHLALMELCRCADSENDELKGAIILTETCVPVKSLQEILDTVLYEPSISKFYHASR